jgi:hypothetical protein
MKKHPDNREREFNPPAVVLARGAFLLLVVSVPSTCLLLLGAAVGHDAVRLGAGFLDGAMGTAVYVWLRRRGLLAKVIASIKCFAADQLPESEADFTNLVRAWDDLSSKRGTPGFDPWRLLSLRREIEAQAKNDPTLADYWRDHLG